MDEDDDAFLYGPGSTGAAKATPQATQPESNGVIAHLEAKAEESRQDDDLGVDEPRVELGDETEQEDAEDEQSESDDDIEIIMAPAARSLDFRQQSTGARAPPTRTVTSSNQPKPLQTSLTTEYTPRARDQATVPTSASAPSVTATVPTPAPPPSTTPSVSTSTPAPVQDSALRDASNLLPVTAPPSHPGINPGLAGTLDGRSILEFDLAALGENKAWRRPGADLSDWFNYGFDEISWETYAYRRRELGDAGAIMKLNVLNFAGMPEDQLNSLPPDLRSMVMTGSSAMMNGAGPQPGMMDMNMMNMNMNMGGDMSMMGGMGMGMDAGQQDGMIHGQHEGYGMGIDYNAIQHQEAQIQQQQMYGQQHPQLEVPAPSLTPTPIPPAGPAAARGVVPGRGAVRGGAIRGRGSYPRGGRPPIPVRPASPLPPGVPTGPRNQNKYKDKDRDAAGVVDGLDYGGGKDQGDDGSSRKRRSPPGTEDGRGSKRR